ncbi:MAG: response regulator [Candidatus Margulisbacteria bacterium]|nr:response regulator [Candidatus Margulisiibacteriota bacterium]
MERKQILVVDDDILIQEMLIICLDDFEIVTANNGKKGMALVHPNSQFDCILTDYQMPEMNGIEFLKHCKITVPNIPIIMMSGVNDIKKIAISNGACAFINKPFYPEILLNELDHLFSLEINKR